MSFFPNYPQPFKLGTRRATILKESFSQVIDAKGISKIVSDGFHPARIRVPKIRKIHPITDQQIEGYKQVHPEHGNQRIRNHRIRMSRQHQQGKSRKSGDLRSLCRAFGE